jgi:hypothetical protein
MHFTLRGGRKVIKAPDGALVDGCQPRLARVETSMVKAIARAFRWKRLLEEGHHATLLEISNAEKINPAYVSRVFRLTLLAPTVVEAILNGAQADDLELDHLLVDFSCTWREQEDLFLRKSHKRRRRT